MFKKIVILGLCLILAGCGASRKVVKSEVAESPEEKEVLVEVEAESLIAPVAGNILATKEQGLEAAKRNAIEKAIGVWITGQQIVSQAALIEEKIFSKVGGYIKDYKVLSQGSDGEFYKTKIWASVKQADIRKQINDLGLLLQTKTVNNPRVVVLIDEYVNGALVSTQTAATVIMAELLSKDYKVVDQEQLDKNKKDDQMLAALRGDEKAAAQIAKKFDAEIAVIGKVESVVKPNPSEYLKDTMLANTTLNLKVVKTTTGEALFAVSKSGKVWDYTADAAVAKMAAKTAGEASTDLSGSIAAKLYESASALITVKGISNLNKLEDFRKAVRYLDGVADARTRDFVEGTAQIELTLKYGNAQLIAAKLENLKDWKIKVDETAGNIVNCTVAK
ncbi:MAG: hypothetical protein A2452_10035 [Candidatus Firestonebacteria bacterium RIFOXYC2_FULL_39_67]|nr:MAG: hypothetical protein A2536_10100 [Candidatus Firestonebacteria bacterium RIFOXYD2_FULL_39_29]OGF55234.1 MAG: hypothetical protein A2452_10035 [Candidatus Firestonebacteria bacterium RIFOXYC2_FULL_39_67]